MPIPEFVRRLREKVGTDLLLVPSAGAVILDDARHILMVRHLGWGRWSFPGGIIEPLETPANAIVRELWEETGLHVRPTRLVGVYGGDRCQTVYPNGDQICFILTMFECAVVGGTLKPDEEEIDRAEFVAPARIIDLDVPPFFPTVLRDLEVGAATAAFDAPTWAPDGRSAR